MNFNIKEKDDPLKNFGAQIRYAKEREPILVREWATKNRDLVQIADNEGFKYVLRREVQKIASRAAQREYRRQFDTRLPEFTVELPEGRFEQLRSAFGGNKADLKSVAEAISHGAS